MREEHIREIKTEIVPGNTRIREITLKSGKMIELPSYIPKIKAPHELNLLCDCGDLERKTVAVCYNLPDYEKIHSDRSQKAEQRDLYGKLTDQNYIDFCKKTPVFFDPCSERLYSTVEEPKKGLIRLYDTPDIVKKAIEESSLETYNPVWSGLKEEKIMPFVRWNVINQTKFNADIILPFSPMINGRSLDIVDCAIEMNVKTADYMFHRTDINGEPAYYFLLSYVALRNKKYLEKIQQFLFFEDDSLQTNDPDSMKSKVKFVFFKILGYENMKSIEYMNLREFTGILSNIKQQKGYAIEILDMDSIGLPLICNGADGFIEPLDGKIGFKRGGGEWIPKGSWYHPGRDFLEDIPFSSVKDVYKENGNRFPCGCKTCLSLNGKKLDEIDDEEWNKIHRRSHRFNARHREIKEIIKAMRDNELRAMTDKIAKCGKYNKLLTDHL